MKSKKNKKQYGKDIFVIQSLQFHYFKLAERGKNTHKGTIFLFFAQFISVRWPKFCRIYQKKSFYIQAEKNDKYRHIEWTERVTLNGPSCKSEENERNFTTLYCRMKQ